MLNKDYKDILSALCEEEVKFVLVGAYALAAHGFPRATMDIDIWVMPSVENADAVLRAIQRFGAPVHDLTREDLEKDTTVFQIGVAPRRIDLITGATGLQFEKAFARSIPLTINGLELKVLSIDDLITNKRATGRTRDLADVEILESHKHSEQKP